MTNFDLEKPTDPGSLDSGDRPDPRLSNGCSEGLGLLVWLGQLARDESVCRSARFGVADSLDPPRVIGRFQLEVLLGAGAYGAVFRALDTHLRRHVALKLAWPGVLMDPVSSRRFVEEPKTTASLKHRGIVEVYDSGEIEMACFIALELVDGPTLADWFKGQEHISVRLAAQIVRSVAETIHFAHARNVIHRDLKPSNILLRPTKGSDTGFPYEPVVTDFGLARRPRPSDLSMVTATHAVVGTDHYMSPEQAAGHQTEVGPASDIFSLGVMLYELIAGRRPFDGESSEQIRQRIQEEEPPAIRPGRKSVPKDLETITLKCLEKAPGRRYASAQDLADDLQRFLDNKPIKARPIAVWQRGWKYTKRRPLVVSLVSLAMASVLAFTGLAGAWISDRMSAARQIEAAEAATAVAEGIERQHQYASNIQHAAEALRRGGRRDVLELLEQCRRIGHESVRCGVEWDYLWTQVNDADQTLAAHDGDVYSVRFSPQGGLLSSAGKDGRVILWNTTNWTKALELNDHMGEVNVAEFSADGSLLALGGDDGRVVVHRIDGSTVFDEPVVDGLVLDITWLGKELQFAVGGKDAVLSVIDPVNHVRRSTAPLPPGEPGLGESEILPTKISALVYLAERNTIAVAMAPRGIHMVDAISMQAVTPSIVTPTGQGLLCRIPSGSSLLAAKFDEEFVIWNPLDGSRVIATGVHGTARALRFSGHEGTIVTAFRSGVVQTWDVQAILTSQQLVGRRFLAHDLNAWTADVSPDGSWLVSGGNNGQIRLWHRRSMNDTFDARFKAWPWATAFSPCGHWFAVVEAPLGEPGRVTMFDARTGCSQWTMERSPTQLSHDFEEASYFAFDPSGDEVAFMDADFSVCGHDPRTGRVIKSYLLPTRDRAQRLQFSPDGRQLIVGGRKTAHLFWTGSLGE